MKELDILVVEDDVLSQKVMAQSLAGHKLQIAGNYASALKHLGSKTFDMCFFDLMLGQDDDNSGLKLIPLAASKGSHCVVMSSCDSEATISKAYELGCKDFYNKGNENSNIPAILAKFVQASDLKNTGDIFSTTFITEDPQTKNFVTEALKYAATDIPILVLGPSGTGKTCLAKILHDHSHRAGDFVAINCAAYTEDLLEAELFGYKKGAFTGAYENRKGKLLQANQGTLFLDEIGSMSHNMQTKLLKAIEEKTFYPVGSDRPEHSSFRLISATLENLQQLLAEQKLRFDFFQRIHGHTVTLKPLSERKNDILPLVEAFTRGRKRLSFERDAKTYLLNHTWPGNIRELKKFVQLAAAGDGQVTFEAVKAHIAQAINTKGSESVAGGLFTTVLYEYALKHGLNELLDRVAYEAIKHNLGANSDKKIKTVEQLRISKRMVYSLLAKFGGENGKSK